jgi:hemicentin
VLECAKSATPCPRGARYADIVQFRMVALRHGIPAHQDLIHLIAYNQFGELLPHTTFTVLEEPGAGAGEGAEPGVPFGIRVEDGKGVVFTVRPLEEKRQYRIKVRAKSYDNSRRDIQYQTTFILFISVSAFPY